MYETELMNKSQSIKFINKFMDKIGTDYEVCDVSEFECTVLCFELNSKEILICKEIEGGLS